MQEQRPVLSLTPMAAFPLQMCREESRHRRALWRLSEWHGPASVTQTPVSPAEQWADPVTLHLPSLAPPLPSNPLPI